MIAKVQAYGEGGSASKAQASSKLAVFLWISRRRRTFLRVRGGVRGRWRRRQRRQRRSELLVQGDFPRRSNLASRTDASNSTADLERRCPTLTLDEFVDPFMMSAFGNRATATRSAVLGICGQTRKELCCSVIGPPMNLRHVARKRTSDRIARIEARSLSGDRTGPVRDDLHGLGHVFECREDLRHQQLLEPLCDRRLVAPIRLDDGTAVRFDGVGGEALLVLASRLALAATLFEDEILGESVVP